MGLPTRCLATVGSQQISSEISNRGPGSMMSQCPCWLSPSHTHTHIHEHLSRTLTKLGSGPALSCSNSPALGTKFLTLKMHTPRSPPTLHSLPPSKPPPQHTQPWVETPGLSLYPHSCSREPSQLPTAIAKDADLRQLH